MEINNYNIDSYSKDYLDRCVDKFRLSLLNEAYLYSRKNGDEQINFVSIDFALRKLLKNRNSDSINRAKRRRLSYLGVLTGLLYTLCGCIIFIIQNSDFEPNKDLGQMVIGIGLAVVVLFTCLGIFFNKRRIYDNEGILQPHRQFLIVEKWSEIEKMVSLICHMKIVTIQSVLPKLMELCQDEITIDDVSSVLFLRNKIVHENVELSQFEFHNAIAIENRILALLHDKANCK